MGIVKLTGLDKYFARLHVLREISVDVAPREVVCIIGRSGSGKSTGAIHCGVAGHSMGVVCAAQVMTGAV